MMKSKKITLIIYTILFYSIWTIFELFCNNLIDNGIGNEFIQQFIKFGIIKNIVWTIPAIFLINYYKSEVYITLKEMFCKKVEWIKYLSVFLIFTAWVIKCLCFGNSNIKYMLIYKNS